MQLNCLGGLGTAGIGSFRGVTSDLFSWSEKKLKKLEHNRLVSFNLTGQVEFGSKIKMAPWLRLQETAKQKTPLDTHTRRYLASTEGGLESNRQGMVPQLYWLDFGSRSQGTPVKVVQLNTKAERLQSCKCEQICFAPKFLCVFNLFWFSKQAKQNKQTKREDSGKQQGSSAAGISKCVHGKQTDGVENK